MGLLNHALVCTCTVTVHPEAPKIIEIIKKHKTEKRKAKMATDRIGCTQANLH